VYRQRRGNNEQFWSSIMTGIELEILHEEPDECAITKIEHKQITFPRLIGSGAFGMVKINFFKQCFKLISGSTKQICIF